MTELWLQLIWKISNILYFDKLNSFTPPSLLSRRQTIFRSNWQVQSIPITFILACVIKEQILPGNNQIAVVSFSHCSQFQVFFLSFLPNSPRFLFFFLSGLLLLLLFFPYVTRKTGRMGHLLLWLRDCEGVWFIHCHFSVASGIWCLHVSLYCLWCWGQMMWNILWNISGFLNFHLGSCCSSPGWGNLCEMPHSLYSLISFVWVANWFNCQLQYIVFSELIRNLGVNAISN